MCLSELGREIASLITASSIVSTLVVTVRTLKVTSSVLLSRQQIPPITGNGVDVGVLDGLVSKSVHVFNVAAGRKVSSKGCASERKLFV